MNPPTITTTKDELTLEAKLFVDGLYEKRTLENLDRWMERFGLLCAFIEEIFPEHKRDPSPPYKIKKDERAAFGNWAPGEYMQYCISCQKTFIGDKRAGTCADCAYDKKPYVCDPEKDSKPVPNARKSCGCFPNSTAKVCGLRDGMNQDCACACHDKH